MSGVERFILGFALLSLWGECGVRAAEPQVVVQRELSSTDHSEEPELFRIAIPPGLSEKHRFVSVAHDAVREQWALEVNGKGLGKLEQIEQPTWSTFEIPAAISSQGIQSIELIPPTREDRIQLERLVFRTDDLTGSPIRGTVSVDIRDPAGESLPVRITLVDEEGFLAPLKLLSSALPCAVRTGVVYGGAAPLSIAVYPGIYRLWITRGPEYERLSFDLSLSEGGERSVTGTLLRSVDTSGWVAFDPHTHTRTHSGHGDATVEERVITFAGEALELPVSTDHNIVADYEPAAKAAEVRSFFTPVVGDEVTTKEAHFNVFPLRTDARLPDFRILEWPRLFDFMRNRSGADVVILNHPHNVHNSFRPFDRNHLNPVSGRILKTLDFSVDAMEVLSSSAQQSDLMLVFRDWFALMNYGHQVVGLGASDVHDVNRYVVGQGRTYLATNDRDVSRIDVDAAGEALREGRALISMGLFVNLTVNERGGVGDVVRAADQFLAKMEVRFPSWMDVNELTLFANGRAIRRESIDQSDYSLAAHGGRKVLRTWDLETLPHDVYLTALATGPGDLGPSWPIPSPYQPSDFPFVPRVVGATNPVWVDCDGDGHYSCARAIAQKIWSEAESEAARAIQLLHSVDNSVAVQVADLAWLDGKPLWNAAGWSQLKEDQRSALDLLRETLQ